MATNQVLKMVFLTTLNKQVTIGLSNPKDTITALEVQAAMDTIPQDSRKLKDLAFLLKEIKR